MGKRKLLFEDSLNKFVIGAIKVVIRPHVEKLQFKKYSLNLRFFLEVNILS